jgi:CDP-glucose 4,6-dehydratase
MESLAVKLFAGQYRGRRVLVIGHTGFKGSWLTLWLSEIGAKVTGLALPPNTIPNHWSLLDLDIPQYLQDIRDAEAVVSIIKETRPEIVFHLAAQPLVRQSYRNPLETWSTNVMGTANVLEACRKTPSVRAIVVVTSDKCYENKEWTKPYCESDRLGGYDPYSASKAAAELVSASYRSAFFDSSDTPLLATARAGNVIGGGDWSEDRLIPDLVRAITNNAPLEIRSPNATRPWQHVLESLGGYLALGQKLLEGKREFAESWNFGPELEGNRSVSELLTQLKANWPGILWQGIQQPQPHEANLLNLDSAKAKSRLGWHPVWTFDETLTATSEWYSSFLGEGGVKSCEQLESYISAAQASGIEWSTA